jgi:hypothetical protein
VTGLSSSGFESVFLRNDTVSVLGEKSVALRTTGFCFPKFPEFVGCEPGLSYATVFNVANTLLRGGLWDIEASGSGGYYGKVEASHSNYRAAKVSQTVPNEIVDLGGNQTAVEPLLSSDFHELAGSPTIDAGVADARLGALDPDGNARVMGAAPDIGAYEFVVPAPPIAGGKSPVTPGPVTPTPPPAVPSATAANANGATVSQTLACAGAASQSCHLTITLTTVEHLAGARLLGVSAARARSRTRRVTVGEIAVTLQAGQVATLKVPLNAIGKRLLRRLHRLPVTVTTSSTGASGQAVRLSSRRLTLTAARKRTHRH